MSSPVGPPPPLPTRRAVALLLVGAAAILASHFLPWGHPRTHWKLFVTNLQTARQVVLEFEPPAWEDAVFFAGEGLPAASPAIPALAAILYVLLVRRSRRAARRVALAGAVLFFGLLAASLLGAAWVLWPDIEESRDPALRLGGGLACLLLLLLEIAIFWMARRRPQADGRGLLILPATLLTLAATVAAITFWGNDQWHAVDYVVLAAGAALLVTGLVSLPGGAARAAR